MHRPVESGHVALDVVCDSCQACIPSLGTRGNLHNSPGTHLAIRKAKDERKIGRRNMPSGFLWPFDQANGILAEIFAQTSIGKLSWIIETIKIKVIPVYARNYVNFNQCISRAFHWTDVPQTSQQSTNQGGFSGTKIAIQPDNHPGHQHGRQKSPKSHRRLLIGEIQRLRYLCLKGTMIGAMQTTHSDVNATQAGLTNSIDKTNLVEKIKDWGRELGFPVVGITRAEVSEAGPRFMYWLELGRHGEMDYMAKNAHLRIHPDRLVPGTITVISAQMPYWPQAKESNAILASPEMGYISRYALGRDYHKTVRARLRQLGERIRTELAARDYALPFNYRVFSDSAPVMEVNFAQKAGIAWRGKHTLSLDRKGSWHFLGEIYTSLDLPPDTPINNHCGTCSRCMDACPTSAIVAPYVVDARLCISYLTIELHGPIPPALRPLIGNRIYGCDDCQTCCPWNRFARIGDADFAVRNGLDAPRLSELFAWSKEEFESRLAGSPIRRIGHERWLRNIAVALGNIGPSETAAAVLSARACDSSALVREHIAWALSRVSP